MEDESKKMLLGLLIIIVVSLLLTYYRSFVSQDYDIIPIEPEIFQEGEKLFTR